jgi:CRP-like cAMP-binding protein
MSTKIANQLLAALSRADRKLLSPDLEAVELDLRASLEEPGKPIRHVYFPESGIISVVVKSGEHRIEAGLIGREGMSGTAVALADHRSPNEAYVQMQGAAQRIGARPFRLALNQSVSLRELVQRFAHVFLIQVAQTAFANGTATIEQRLARWLLMAHDRQDEGELDLTHEFISVMLGVRRSGVTDALHQLESKRLIRANRGSIRIVSRKGLTELAGSIYGIPEAEYKRLFR